MTKEALKLALEALESVLDDSTKVLQASISGGLYEVVQCRDAITAIKAALAKPEERNFCPRCGKRTADLTAIHTCTPPQPMQEDSCFCHDGASLQMVSGGAAPEGYLGKVTLLIDGEYVEYVKALPVQPVPVAKLFGSLPVYETTPQQRQWVGLTDDEIKEIHNESRGKDVGVATGLTERKLKEKNT